MPWIEFGLLWGIAALNSPTLLSFLPAAGLWAWYRRSKSGKPSLRRCCPRFRSLLRLHHAVDRPQLSTFGKFIFIRDNFGAELRLGNGNGADGTLMIYLDPTQDVYAMRQYQSMGELAYIAMRKQQALDYIRADYPRFAVLCFKRFVYFWAGPPKATEPDGWGRPRTHCSSHHLF